MTSTPDTAPSAAYLDATLGLLAYTRSVACTRYAKDADKAPTMNARFELLQISAEQVAALHTVLDVGTGVGIDVTRSSAQYVGALGDLDERLRPADWPERLVKTYLAMGLVSDFCLALIDRFTPELRGALIEALGADRFGEIAAAHLLDDVDGDSQLAARLGLWGRRVAGEEIGSLQILAAHVPLLREVVGPEVLTELLSQGASSRMRGLGLRV